MGQPEQIAPGSPGIEPRWTSSAKSGVGTALTPESHIWFTLSHGILNEVYYPRVDRACTRDLGLIVTDGRGFFSDEKRHASSEVRTLADGVPAYRLVNTCEQGHYTIEKEIIADPRRDVLLQRTVFTPLQGPLEDYQLFVLLAPHLANCGSGNTGWLGDYKGVPMLFAQRDACALALACSVPWSKASAGFVGFSDGWQDLSRNFRLTQEFARAENGNVALTGQIDLQKAAGSFVLALGFGSNAAEAGHRALASLQDGFDTAMAEYQRGWKAWQRSLIPLDKGHPAGRRNFYRMSAAVIRSHEAVHFPGGIIASLSVPWGFSKGDDDLGGYHLAWPRDLAESAGALLAAGAFEDGRRVLSYLETTQEADGHWPQNMWLDGSPYWDGIQLDEAALPILLADLARREKALDPDGVAHFWPMVRKAAGFIVRNGPVTQQDRWEEDPGYSPFTLAAEIAGLLAAAEFAELNGESALAVYLREIADVWNDSIERWIYATDGPWITRFGVDGYYVRIAPAESAEGASPLAGFVPIKNRPPGQSSGPACQMISPDALALVRFGLRAADDPRIINTIKIIDALLKVETPRGPAWRRYNGDGYGEHDDGSPFDGTGVGRPWPLLAGERGHYELAAGRAQEAERLLHAMEAFASDGGLIPEQVWDGPEIPERELAPGRPSGSAMPLVWAHAEYIKLRRSLRDGRMFDLPPQTVQRYQVDKIQSKFAIWSFNHKITSISTGKTLRLQALAPARVRWSSDGWRTAEEIATRDTTLGIHLADLPITKLGQGSQVRFTFYWPGADRWEGAEFSVEVR